MPQNLDYFCTSQDTEASAIATVPAAIALQRQRWASAIALDIDDYILNFARLFGENSGMGQDDWMANHEGMEIQRHHRIASVWLAGTMVYSSDPKNQFIIPGDWLGMLYKMKPKIDERLAAEAQEHSEEDFSAARARILNPNGISIQFAT